jgi:hypothetical protein
MSMFGQVLDWPPGNGGNDTVISGEHLDLDALRDYNYLLYANETISNGTNCYLTFPPYNPINFRTNGTFQNATWCYWAVNPIAARGKSSIGLAAGFGLTLVLTLTVLTKHGKLYLPREKRFYPIGRRWQWYFGSICCALSLVSLLMNIDVDRYYLPDFPLVVSAFFWYLMCMATTAVVWEATRHWASWLERQYIDPDPFSLSEDDRRAKIEFYLPLWFYFWWWMVCRPPPITMCMGTANVLQNFFMIIPRNWDFVKKQRYPEETARVAEATATGIRFKLGAFFLFVCWLTICFSICHSIKNYKPRHRGIFNRTVGFIGSIPLRFVLLVPLLLGLIGYQALISFEFDFSLMNLHSSTPIVFGWGYGIQLVILWVQIIYGAVAPNEDKELMRQRRARGAAVDQELGIVRRPAWWRRVKGEHLLGFRDKLVRNVKEVGGERATGRRTMGDMERDIRVNMQQEARDDDGPIELSTYSDHDPHNPRVDRAGARNIPRRYPDTPEGALERELDRRVPSDERQRIYSMINDMARRAPEEEERQEQEEAAMRAAHLRYITEDGPTAEEEYARRVRYISEDGPAAARVAPPPYSSRPVSTAERTSSIGSADSVNRPPTQVRSMLDI